MTKKKMIRPLTRKLTIVAQDPSVRIRNRQGCKILTTQVDIPAEALSPGPSGYRVQVIDYDSSTNTLYKPLDKSLDEDPFINVKDAQILSDPNFHGQNVYAIVMRTLARFEFALGRRVDWAFHGPQIKVAPHAFADANAFYSERDQSLMFGYFPGRKGMVFSCLSHDVIAHETTHALIDGFRERYSVPTSIEQEAFHEGFADIVALLSIFSLPAIVGTLIDSQGSLKGKKGSSSRYLIDAANLTPNSLRSSALFGLADEMGQELSGVRGEALRRSAKLRPSPSNLSRSEFMEPHRRGEVLVAAMINAFIEVWVARLKGLGKVAYGGLDRSRVVEEGANAADYLLTMAIRALDYTPPVDLQFSDFLSALLTADHEIRPDDSKYNFRKILLNSFYRYGIWPASEGDGIEQGLWIPAHGTHFYERTHFESMQRDRVEIFRFIWENRRALGLYEGAYNRVSFVRPCLRIGPDGFSLKETVAEYLQLIRIQASNLKRLGILIPIGMLPQTPVILFGGGTLIFDEYGELKFHIKSPILDAPRQTYNLKYLWDRGYFHKDGALLLSIANMHRKRAVDINPIAR